MKLHIRDMSGRSADSNPKCTPIVIDARTECRDTLDLLFHMQVLLHGKENVFRVLGSNKLIYRKKVKVLHPYPSLPLP